MTSGIQTIWGPTNDELRLVFAAAAAAIAEVTSIFEAAPYQPNDYRRNPDQVATIAQAADALRAPRLVRRADGSVGIRPGVDILDITSPRGRLYHRMQFEALKASGIVDEL